MFMKRLIYDIVLLLGLSIVMHFNMSCDDERGDSVENKKDNIDKWERNEDEEQIEENSASNIEEKNQVDSSLICTISGTLGGASYVDLGLPSGILWATYNIGAKSPQEYGDYYAFGETSQWNYAASCNYSYSIDLCDNDKHLYSKFDVATTKWGNYWRMPTDIEFYELRSNCRWKYVKNYDNSGINGFIGTSKINGTKIFIPAGGCWNSQNNTNESIGEIGYYWSSYYLSDKKARGQYFSAERMRDEEFYRADGIMVRAVTNLEKCNDEISLTNKSGSIGGHDYVDLGLSIKWATCNLGAATPEKSGDYYAWGEVKPWAEYTYGNYVFNAPYCNYSKILLPNFDAATMNWGNYWRMPTITELDELVNGCSWKYVVDYNQTGINGFLGYSRKNGNSIFLPATGYWDRDYYTNSTYGQRGYYRASDYLGNSIDKAIGAWCEMFMSGLIDREDHHRADGVAIRPVTKLTYIEIPNSNVSLDEYETQKQGVPVNGKRGGHTYVDLGLPSGKKWATYNIGASSPEEYGDYFAWGETKPKQIYTEETYSFFIGYDEISSLPQLSKYVRFQKHGAFDNKLTIEAIDDAAVVNWGGEWRMPTQKDIEELVAGCNWKRVDGLNGKNVIGYMGYSKYNDMKIYMPASGFEYSTVPNTHMTVRYWSSDIYRHVILGTERIDTDYKAAIITSHSGSIEVTDWERNNGLTIRAVTK